MKTHNMNRISWRKAIKYATFLLIAATTDLAHSQGTIICVSGLAAPPNGTSGYNGDLGVGTSLSAVAWSSPTAFSNVSISVALQGDSGATGVAYLMTRIGLGTTKADQIASASLAFPATSSLTPVFSGLSLGSGLYVLVIQKTANGSSGNGVWQSTTSPTVTSTASATAMGEYWYHGSFPSYVPASDFNGDVTTYYEYTVASVLEPSVAWLLLLGGGFVFVFIHKAAKEDQMRRPGPTARGGRWLNCPRWAA